MCLFYTRPSRGSTRVTSVFVSLGLFPTSSTTISPIELIFYARRNIPVALSGSGIKNLLKDSSPTAR